MKIETGTGCQLQEDVQQVSVGNSELFSLSI